jgi:threonine dehydratase
LTVTLREIQEARIRIADIIEKTPLDFSQTLSTLSQNQIYLKLENLQRTGSFKIRGAFNKMSTLTHEEKARGVIAASAGNHAQGVAYAAKWMGVPCTIVMPTVASLSKVEATRKYGAQIVLHGQDYDEAFAKAQSIKEATGATYIHAFDDEMIIAGQGTIGIEVLEQLPDLEAIVVPMGGGGLISGIAIAAKTLKPDIRIIGVEAKGAAGFKNSLAANRIEELTHVATIADGIAVKRPGILTFDAVKTYVDDVVLVDDEEIARAMVVLIERSKVVSEGSSAAGIAAAITKKLPFENKKTAIILSGGNVDVLLLSRIIEHGLVAAGRHIRFVTTLPDRPGALVNLLTTVAETGANIVSIEHHRLGQALGLGQVEVQLAAEMRNWAHIEELKNKLHESGYDLQLR